MLFLPLINPFNWKKTTNISTKHRTWARDLRISSQRSIHPATVLTAMLCFFSDVNECEFVRSTDSLHPNDPCLHQCENLLGSYRCYCKDGYRLTGDRCEGNKWQISSCQLSYRPGLGCWKTGWHYPVDSVVCFANTYPLDTDQSRGKSYPSSEQLGPEG